MQQGKLFAVNRNESERESNYQVVGELDAPTSRTWTRLSNHGVLCVVKLICTRFNEIPNQTSRIPKAGQRNVNREYAI